MATTDGSDDVTTGVPETVARIVPDMPGVSHAGLMTMSRKALIVQLTLLFDGFGSGWRAATLALT
jgi:hypothetical protein